MSRSCDRIQTCSSNLDTIGILISVFMYYTTHECLQPSLIITTRKGLKNCIRKTVTMIGFEPIPTLFSVALSIELHGNILLLFPHDLEQCSARLLQLPQLLGGDMTELLYISMVPLSLPLWHLTT